jgi:hypothetical protein
MLDAHISKGADSMPSTMINLDAPIVPGESAAGILVGSDIRDLVGEVPALSKSSKHDFGPVKVWSSGKTIKQVGVYSGYRGSLGAGIHIGSTIDEVQHVFACEVQEDEEDNLIVPCSPGWCFETEHWTGNHTVKESKDARITAIFVLKPT